MSSLNSKEKFLLIGGSKSINNGKSLLPAGIKKLSGDFDKGENILVKDENNSKLARGLTSFSSE